jgi:hypothetical protein
MAVVVCDHVTGEDLAVGNPEDVALSVGGILFLVKERPASIVVVPEVVGIGDESEEGCLGLTLGILWIGSDSESPLYRRPDGRKLEGDEEFGI